MKALFLTQLGDIDTKTLGKFELRDLPIPEPGDEDVLIKVAYASICGTDVHSFKGDHPFRLDMLSCIPMRLGHEVSGVIMQVGKRAKECGFMPGDRVTCNDVHFCGSCYFCRTGRENFCMNKLVQEDGMSEYICWHMSQVFKIPDNVSLLYASQTEPLSVAVNANRIAQVRYGSRVGLFGCGGVGLMALQIAKMGGASQVVVFDIVQEKLEVAKDLGADVCINMNDMEHTRQAMALTGGLGFDSIIESTGVASVAQRTLDLLSPDGHAVYFGLYGSGLDLKVSLKDLFFRQMHLHGMMAKADIFPYVVSLLHRVNFDTLTVYKLDDYEQAFTDALSGKLFKIALEIDGGLDCQ